MMAIDTERVAPTTKLAQIVLGFSGAFLLSLALGACGVLLLEWLFPKTLSSIARLVTWRKAMLVLALDSFWLIPLGFLWRRKRYLASGIMIYLVYELLHISLTLLLFGWR